MRWGRDFSKTGWALAAVFAALAVLGAVWLGAADKKPLRDAAKRQARGQELRLEHHMAAGFRQAAWASLLVGIAGVATAGWWARKGDAARGEASALALRDSASAFPWRTVAAVGLLAMGVSATLRWPRLHHSFWTDEAYAARAYVFGVNKISEDGRLAHQPVEWPRALFYNEKSNNHVWCTIEARTALRLWQKLGGHPPGRFSEAVMRAPAFVWGTLTVGVVTALGALAAGRGGTVAGLVLAVHPWHVRFAAEMRGYSAMLLAVTLGVLFLWRALRDGRWRWFLSGALMNLWAMLAFVGSVYVLAVANGAALLWLWRKKRGASVSRLLAANALVAVVFWWLYSPSVQQLLVYLAKSAEEQAYQIDGAWFRSLWDGLSLGVTWEVLGAAWHERSLLPNAGAARWAVWGLGAFFVWRLARAAWANRRGLLIPAVFLAGGALCIAQNWATSSPVLVWYLLPVLPGMALIFGHETEFADAAWPKPLRWLADGAEATVLAACLFAWAACSIPMAALPRQPMREAAQAVHAPEFAPVLLRLCSGFQIPEKQAEEPPSLSMEIPPASRLTGAIGISDQQMPLYDPTITIVKTVADLEALETRAAAEKKEIYLSVCGWELARQRQPELMARLDSGSYEAVGGLPGWEDMFSYRILKKR